MNTESNHVLQEMNRIAASHPNLATAFGGPENLCTTLEAITRKTGDQYFMPGANDEETMQTYSRLHLTTYHNGDRPSLPGLAMHHTDKLKIDRMSPEYAAMMMVALRAEMQTTVPEPAYHSRNHYIDVAAMAAILLQKNDEMAAAGTGGVLLSPQDKALLLLTAIGHDLDHEGRGNPPGLHYFNETKSFNTLLPILQEAGLTQEDIARLHIILLTTSPNAPHAVLKEIVKAFREGEDPAAVFKKPADVKTPDGETLGEKFPELKILAEDRKLAQMAAILSDADLSGSGGMGMDSNMDNSLRLTKEVTAAGIHMDFTTDGARLFFLEHIIGKDGFASDAGRALMNGNFYRMQTLTRTNVAKQTVTAPPKSSPPKI